MDAATAILITIPTAAIHPYTDVWQHQRPASQLLAANCAWRLIQADTALGGASPQGA
jgi:hypothetical protein